MKVQLVMSNGLIVIIDATSLSLINTTVTGE